MTRITGTLSEDQYMFLNTSCSILLRMTNVSDESCGEDQNTHLSSVTFCLENRDIYEIMWKTIVKPYSPQVTI
jgi:hypothetical protein